VGSAGTGAIAGGANVEQGFDSIANIARERCRPRAIGGDGERFAHGYRDGERPGHGRRVGQVFFESFDRLEHAFRARVPLEIAGRIE